MIARNGLEHTVPDCLSRCPNSSEEAISQDDQQFFDSRIFRIDDIGRAMREEQRKDAATSLPIEQLDNIGVTKKGRFHGDLYNWYIWLYRLPLPI